ARGPPFHEVGETQRNGSITCFSRREGWTHFYPKRRNETRLPGTVRIGPDSLSTFEFYVIMLSKHINLLETILTRLEEHNFTVNPLKCEWAVQETDFLGYWLTPHGAKAWSRKVDSIVNMKKPETISQLRGFIGLVGFYNDLFPRRSHILAPLTSINLPKGARLGTLWTPACQTAFEKMKSIVAADCLLAYPNHNKTFYIYTDASDYQLGAVIMQHDDDGVLRPVAYFSQKLNPAQRNYSTIEKELLSIVMTLKTYKTMLYGADLQIYTDHKNLTFENFNTQRVLRWRCFIEEFHPRLFYIEGKNNILADAFSRLPRHTNPNVEATELDILFMESPEVCCRLNPAAAFARLDCDECVEDVNCVFFGDEVMEKLMLNLPTSDEEVLDCFLGLPYVPMQENPLNMRWIADCQNRDNETRRLRNNPSRDFHLKKFGDVEVLVYVANGVNPDNNWKIVLTEETIKPVINWFHEIGGHSGQTRLYAMIDSRYYYPGLRKEISELNCDICQRYKDTGPRYGHLPARDQILAPWYELAVDSIGPWFIDVGGTRSQAGVYEFRALTCIDTVTNLTELIRTEGAPDSTQSCHKLDQAWMCRYPWPKRVVHDGGPEFKANFQTYVQNKYQVKTVQTTAHNPQANAICERMHLTVQQLINIYCDLNQPRTREDARAIVDRALSTASHALRINISRSLGNNTPGALAFGRDMLLDLPFIADWQAVRENRRLLIDENLRRSNQKRRTFDYQPGQQVLKRRPGILRKLGGPRFDGPFEIVSVHVNGNATIRLSPSVTERVNIRRLKPYRVP
ncbi:hypothetical protein THAOC_09464, partial [Thalassiosira oceanica]